MSEIEQLEGRKSFGGVQGSTNTGRTKLVCALTAAHSAESSSQPE